MSKEFEIRSRSLNLLNETIRKANLFGVTIVKSPLKENDKFVSVLSTDNSFNSDILKNDGIEINGLSDKQRKEKNKLTTDILTKINDTLKTNKEIYSLLDKVKQINQKDNSAIWIRNDEKNTAELSSKNAKIFLQNNNICLSHNGKIEVFHSVCELHDWLKENNYPLPKDIKLHEAKEKLHEFNILNNRSFAKNILGIDPDTNDKTLEYTGSQDIVKPKANPDKWYLSFPIGSKGKIIINNNQIPLNYTGEKKYLKYNYENFKKFNDMLTDDVNQAFPFASKKHAEMIQVRIYNKFLKNLIPVKLLDNSNQLFGLEYTGTDYTSQNTEPSTPKYLKNHWKIDGALFTNDIKQAKLFTSESEARIEIKNITKEYPKLKYEFKPIKIDTNQLEECGVTSSGLGAAVTWLANKNLDEAEGNVFGYEGTPYEDTWYPDKISRASAYLKWLFNSENGYTTLDPNFKQNFSRAIEEFEGKQMRSRADELWGSKYKSRYEYEHPMFRGLINPETKTIDRTPEYYERIKQINQKYGIDLNPEEPVIGKEISPHNKAEKSKWVKDFFSKIYNHGVMVKNANLKKDQYEKNRNLDDKIEDTIRDLKNMHMTAVNNPKMYGRKGSNTDTITKYLTNIINNYKNEIKDKEIYNPIIDKFINANAEFPKNGMLDQAILDKLRELKDARLKKNSEQILKEDDSPADFATSTTSDMDSDNTASLNQGNEIDNSENIDLNSMLPETDIPNNTNPTFGDINIDAGNEDYSPDSQENAQIPVGNKYKVLDILVNDEDSSDIKVKLKNLDTDEIEIKNLSEIDL